MMADSPTHLAAVDETTFVPPHSCEAEAAVLGAALLEAGEAKRIVTSGLDSDDFFIPRHREIFKAITALDAGGTTPDLVTVADELKVRGELDRCGGPGALIDLINATPTTVNTARYLKIVRDHARSRALVSAADEIYRMAADGARFDEMTEMTEMVLAAQRAQTDSSRLSSLGSLVDAVYDRCERGGQVEHVPTGLSNLDSKIRGFTSGALSIVAGRPGMGKTIFALTVAVNAAQHSPVLFFSIELTRPEIANRAVAALDNIDLRRVLDGALTEHDWAGHGCFNDHPQIRENLTVVEGPVSAAQIIAITKTEIAKGRPPALIVIDHIGLVLPRDRRANRWEEASQTSRDLKYFAAESGAAVLALCQINRELENTKQRRPTIANLRESGSHEQDADLVLLLYREAYYDPDQDENKAEVIIGKSRSGTTGKVDLTFAGRFAKFTDRRQTSFDWMKES